MTRRSSFAAALIAASFASACSILPPEPDPTRFSVLATVDELPDGPQVEPTTDKIVLGLGPVVVPEYLLRPEVQTRIDGTRLVPSGREAWGEPLDRGLERVLSVDLARALGAERVVVHPWYATDRPDVQVRIVFTRFERTSPREIVLSATWSVVRVDGSAAPEERETRLVRDTESGDGASAALALSRALADLSREIGDVWRASSIETPR